MVRSPSERRLIRTAIPLRYPIQRARVLAILARWARSMDGGLHTGPAPRFP
jgi:hypothetical protein